LKQDKSGDKQDNPAVSKEDILKRSGSEFEAVVAIAREARRLNAVPGVYLDGDEKPLPRAVENFVDGRVEYQIEGGAVEKKKKKRGRK